MLNNKGLKDDVGSGVLAKCARTVTFLSSITSIKDQEKCRFQLLFEYKKKLAPGLGIFGKMGVITTKNDI
jgi:hypothetical protein